MSRLKAPNIVALAGESLSPLEFTRLAAALPSLARQPKGSGDPVMVLPGFGASDASTAPLRHYLTWLGYDVRGWGLGRNAGRVAEVLPYVVEQVRAMSQKHGSEVHLIGWSLGGVFARETAREHPGYVCQVVTMGSPVVGGPKYTTMGRMFDKRGANLDEIEAAITARESTPIAVPLTSIYSKRDGIVGWQASIDRHSPQVENIEVYTTHLGLGISPEVYKIIAAKLAGSTPRAVH